MQDLMIALAYAVMVLLPAFVATFHSAKSLNLEA